VEATERRLGFRVSPVMTASIPLQNMFPSIKPARKRK